MVVAFTTWNLKIIILFSHIQKFGRRSLGQTMKTAFDSSFLYTQEKNKKDWACPRTSLQICNNNEEFFLKWVINILPNYQKIINKSFRYISKCLVLFFIQIFKHVVDFAITDNAFKLFNFNWFSHVIFNSFSCNLKNI